MLWWKIYRKQIIFLWNAAFVLLEKHGRVYQRNPFRDENICFSNHTSRKPAYFYEGLLPLSSAFQWNIQASGVAIRNLVDFIVSGRRALTRLIRFSFRVIEDRQKQVASFHKNTALKLFAVFITGLNCVFFMSNWQHSLATKQTSQMISSQSLMEISPTTRCLSISFTTLLLKILHSFVWYQNPSNCHRNAKMCKKSETFHGKIIKQAQKIRRLK